ncbi:hypothetical protein HYU89_00625 [Candidatus Collierbacteria bacterium]|nr:hypothetical protein [Candidatus Collierbacteria bacterium]
MVSDRTLIGVTGVRGVGKTSAIKSICEQKPEMTAVYMSERLKEFSLKTTQAPFFNHDISTRDQIRSQFGAELTESLRVLSGLILIDFHLTDVREGAGKIIQPDCILREINDYLFLDASDETIIKRRKLGELRGRNLDVRELAVERNAELAALQLVTGLYASQLLLIQAEGAIFEVQTEIFNALARFGLIEERCQFAMERLG